METYSKLSSALVHSTVWREPDHVRLVWITMLALKDKEGAIRASVPGLADAARVSLEKTVEALARLAAPDEWSRSKAEDGRRIREIPGGWQLINAELYRLLGTSDERRAQVRKAVQKHRNHVITGNQGKPKKSTKSPISDQDQDQDQILYRGSELPDSPKDPVPDPPTELAGSDPTDRTREKGRAAPRPKFNPETAKGFSAFWRIFPNKVNKARAVQTWLNHKGSLGIPAQGNIEENHKLIPVILNAIAKQAPRIRESAEQGARLHASTWLADSRWTDEVSGSVAAAPDSPSARMFAKASATNPFTE